MQCTRTHCVQRNVERQAIALNNLLISIYICGRVRLARLVSFYFTIFTCAIWPNFSVNAITRNGNTNYLTFIRNVFRSSHFTDDVTGHTHTHTHGTILLIVRFDWNAIEISPKYANWFRFSVLNGVHAEAERTLHVATYWLWHGCVFVLVLHRYRYRHIRLGHSHSTQ